MYNQVNLMKRRRNGFTASASGSALVETIVVLPVMIVFMMGILEFGAFLWTKLQVENGLKDAARYMGRCAQSPAPSMSCTQAAQNLAVFGYVNSSGKKGRAGNWDPADVTITPFSRSNGLSGIAADNVDGWSVSTSFRYPGAIFLSGLGIGSVTLSARHEERNIGL